MNSGIDPSVQIIPSQPIPLVQPSDYEFELNSRTRPLRYNTEYWKHVICKRNVKPVPIRPATTSDENSRDVGKFVIGGTQALTREFPHMVIHLNSKLY